MRTSFFTQRIYTRSTGLKNTFGDFTCMNCHSFVHADAVLSGVRNRNHCPYCLASRHLDLFESGDRLSACKGAMLPVALTWKRSRKKYARHGDGELMLVHCCRDCGSLSINRIAVDDDNMLLMSLLCTSANLDRSVLNSCSMAGIDLLGPADTSLVSRCLFGRDG
jgi:hypothetical protein